MDLTPALKAVSALNAAQLSTWAKALEENLPPAGLTTPARAAMFIGQCSVESNRFTELQENLFYTTPQRILEVFPHEVSTLAQASTLVCSPQALANVVYAGRNGNSQPGDGWRYHGRGLIQVTGRENYRELALFDPRAFNPDWLLTIEGAVSSAVWFVLYQVPGFLELCDGWEVTRVTELITGSQQALPQRLEACNQALEALQAAPNRPPTADQLDLQFNQGESN